MSRTWASIVALCVLLSSSTRVAAASSPGLSESLDVQTARLIDTIKKRRAKLTPQNFKAAHRLNADGDRAYRQKDYAAAFTAYVNSYPNAPNAYAYIMTGDARWRGGLQHQTREGGSETGCWDNGHFARELAFDLAEHHDVGLALAVHDGNRRFLKSTFYRRARESAACLRDMARRYETEAPEVCIDLDQLRRCLGKPLIQ